MEDAVDLIRHEFGHHTIETLMRYGLPSHKHTIAEALKRDLWTHATDRSGTYVLKLALVQCDAQDREALVKRLLKRGSYGLDVLKRSQWGVHVLRALQMFVAEQALTND